MLAKRMKSLLVAVFSLGLILICNISFSQPQSHNGPVVAEHGTTVEKEEKIDAAKVIMEHIMDSHEFHFAEIGGHPVSISLPVILYSPQRGFNVFSSSKFQHGHAAYRGYKLK